MKHTLCGGLLILFLLTILCCSVPVLAATDTVVLYDGQGPLEGYTDFAAAVDHCQPNQYLKLTGNHTVDLQLSADLYIDLNGYCLSGHIEANGFRVSCMDSTTNQYGPTSGRYLCHGALPQRITTTSTAMTGQIYRYLAVESDGGWAFHRFYLGITHTTLDTAACGIGFRAAFRGSEAVAAQLHPQQAFGYRLQLAGHGVLEQYKPQTQFAAQDQLTLLIRNWDLENHAETPLSAQAFLRLADGTLITGTDAQLTFRQTVLDIDRNYQNFTQSQLDAVYGLMEANPIMLTWGIQNLPVKPQCTQHTDTNNNGLCDRCDISVLVSFQVYSINDLHGKFTDGSNQPGVDELTTYFKNARKNNDHVILLSAGDMWQGGAESNLTQGLIVTDWMNHMDFTAMTLGNHEFDWGEQAIIENEALAEFPFLAINIYDSDTRKQVDYCDSSVMVDLGQVQVGIIGAIGNCYSSISADKVQDVYFITGSQLTQLVKAEAQALREQGADFIIYTVHDGRDSGSSATSSLGYYDTALSNGYVDLVFEGHTHQRYLFRDNYGVYHAQGGGDNSGISQASVTLNFANGNTQVTAQTLTKTAWSTLLPDPLIQQLLDQYEDVLSDAYQVLGRNAKKRDSTQICKTVAQLYCQAGIEKWGSKYNIILGGGFLTCRSPYNLYAGKVTYDMLLSLLPFDNQLVLCRVNGKDLYQKFINSSNNNYHIYLSDYAKANPPINNSLQTYYIVVDSYTASYAPNNLTVVAEFDPGIYARDLLAQYIREGNWN